MINETKQVMKKSYGKKLLVMTTTKRSKWRYDKEACRFVADETWLTAGNKGELWADIIIGKTGGGAGREDEAGPVLRLVTVSDGSLLSSSELLDADTIRFCFLRLLLLNNMNIKQISNLLRSYTNTCWTKKNHNKRINNEKCTTVDRFEYGPIQYFNSLHQYNIFYT